MQQNFRGLHVMSPVCSLATISFAITLLLGTINGTPLPETINLANVVSTITDDTLPFMKLKNGSQCIQFTLNASEYAIESNGQIRLKKDQNTAIDAEDYTISSKDNVANVCYPISRELKQCIKTTNISPSTYTIMLNKTLSIKDSTEMYILGNYYITDNGDAVICTSVPTSKRRRRSCNYLLLSPGEYKIKENKGLFLMPSGEKLPNTNYTLDPVTNIVNACYPLSAQFLNCSSWWILESREIEVLPNKMLFSKPHEEHYGLGDYFLIEGNRAVTCSKTATESKGFNVYTIHAIAHILSAICLAIAIFVHLILPDLSYQRAPLLCHAISLLITYVCLASRQLESPMDEGSCYLLFYITYFFALGAFCWLSVLAFDLWNISSSLRRGTVAYPWVTSFLNKRFLLYSIFAWGVPLLLTLFVILVDYHDHIQDNLGLYPQIAARCWFNERPSSFAFFYGPLCLLLITNFVLIGLSVYNIWFAGRHAEFPNKKLNKQLLVICFVVFLAMGLFWIMEVVSYGTKSEGSLYWFVPDLINSLQGVIVAAIYTCRPLTWRLLKEKFCQLRTRAKH